jgi:hypothetical protein
MEQRPANTNRIAQFIRAKDVNLAGHYWTSLARDIFIQFMWTFSSGQRKIQIAKSCLLQGIINSRLGKELFAAQWNNIDRQICLIMGCWCNSWHLASIIPCVFINSESIKTEFSRTHSRFPWDSYPHTEIAFSSRNLCTDHSCPWVWHDTSHTHRTRLGQRNILVKTWIILYI